MTPAPPPSAPPEFQSPVTDPNLNANRSSSDHQPDSSFNINNKGEFIFLFNQENTAGAAMGRSDAPSHGRSRPRLTKIRKPAKKVGSDFFNPFRNPVPDKNTRRDNEGPTNSCSSGNSNSNGSSSNCVLGRENGGSSFMFRDNKTLPNSNKEENNRAFVFNSGLGNGKFVPKDGKFCSKVGHGGFISKSSTCELGSKNGDFVSTNGNCGANLDKGIRGFVFGAANKSSATLNLGSETKGFVFGDSNKNSTGFPFVFGGLNKSTESTKNANFGSEHTIFGDPDKSNENVSRDPDKSNENVSASCWKYGSFAFGGATKNSEKISNSNLDHGPSYVFGGAHQSCGKTLGADFYGKGSILFGAVSNAGSSSDSKRMASSEADEFKKFGGTQYALPPDSLNFGKGGHKEGEGKAVTGDPAKHVNFSFAFRSSNCGNSVNSEIRNKAGISECGKSFTVGNTFNASNSSSDTQNNEPSGVRNLGVDDSKNFTSAAPASNINMEAMRTCEEKYNFVFGGGSSSSGGSDQHPVSTLSDNMKTMKIDGTHGVGGAKYDSKLSTNVDNIFVFGSRLNSSGLQMEGASVDSCNGHLDGIGKVNDVENIGGTTSIGRDFAAGNDEKIANLFRGILENMPSETENNTRADIGGFNKQETSWFFSAGTFGKENMPFNLKERTSNKSQVPRHGTVNVTESSTTAVPPSSTSAGVSFQTNGSVSEAGGVGKKGFIFTSPPVGLGSSCTEFSAPNPGSTFTANLFPEFSNKLDFSTNSRPNRDRKLKKAKGKLRHRSRVEQLFRQDQSSKEGNPQEEVDESPGCCSPMDFSPYQGSNGEPYASSATMASDTKNEDVAAPAGGFGINEANTESREPNMDDFARHGHNSNESDRNSAFSSSSPARDGLSAIRRQYKKKYKMKVGHGSSSTRFSSFHQNSSHLDPANTSGGVMPNSDSKRKDISGADNKLLKEGLLNAVAKDSCELWRIRGNEAYKCGDLSKAEEFYTKGIESVHHTNISGSNMEPLLLCYSNRAATRMSLGRMREALGDCTAAEAVDPSFLKVKIRAGNCHLVLGEVQEATQYYNKCLGSEGGICLDRRITIEAADGIQKAQKVAECMHQSVKLLQQKTSDAASSALKIIAEALSVSCYSEKLLEMKGEALCMLQRYDEAIELCEQSLHIAEKNFAADALANLEDPSVRLWRWQLMSKSYYHLGKLEVALDLIEKQEFVSNSNKFAGTAQESSVPLSSSIRELLGRKRAGNESFKSGKHTEAVEHYTAAISSSSESRPFAAICFCNRAAAYQALGQIVDAISDCSLAIALDGNYPKAVLRRASLHEMIRDYEHAVDDLKRFISLLEYQSQERNQKSVVQDRSGGNITKELKQARARLSSLEEKAKKGIPLDLYLILGIKPSDKDSDIKKAYRKAALKHHPDKAGQLVRYDSEDVGGLWKEVVGKVHKDADRLFKMIGEAYAVLSDPDKRSKYDYEEEIRDACRDNYRGSSYGKSSDCYNSPYDRDRQSGRQHDFYSSPYGASDRRYGQGYWKSHGNSRSRW